MELEAKYSKYNDTKESSEVIDNFIYISLQHVCCFVILNINNDKITIIRSEASPMTKM